MNEVVLLKSQDLISSSVSKTKDCFSRSHSSPGLGPLWGLESEGDTGWREGFGPMQMWVHFFRRNLERQIRDGGRVVITE